MKKYILGLVLLFSANAYAEKIHVESDVYYDMSMAMTSLEDKLVQETHALYSQKWGKMLLSDFIACFDAYPDKIYHYMFLSLRRQGSGFKWIVNADVDMDFNPKEAIEAELKDEEVSEEGLVEI